MSCYCWGPLLFDARVDGCLAAALWAYARRRSVSQIVTSHGLCHLWGHCPNIIGPLAHWSRLSFRNGTATGSLLLIATTSAPSPSASLAQLVEHALRKRMVVGSIPTGGLATAGDTETGPGLNSCSWWPMLGDFDSAGICCAR